MAFPDLDSPGVDDLAVTINTFGNLMQTTLPLFDVTLAVKDEEFSTVAGLSGITGLSLATSIGAGGWMWLGAASTGPLGLLAVAGTCAGAFGAATVVQGVKWNQRQKTNRTLDSQGPSV